MKDRYGREIDYLRFSITDRCNLRCKYCMPDGIELCSMQDILSYEEFLQIAEAAAKLGIQKIKVTGGEPLVRRGCVNFIRNLKKVPGISKVTLTTNGIALAEHVEELAEAGIDGVNISLDTCDQEKYREITGGGDMRKVTEGIEACLNHKIPTKINCVLMQGFNAAEWNSMMELAKSHALDVRFIEMMPIGEGRTFKGISNKEIRQAILAKYPEAAEDTTPHGNGPAVYIKIPGFQGSVGFISAIHEQFCSNCNRVRVTSNGNLKQCLCYDQGVDLRSILRSGDVRMLEMLQEAMRESIYNKPMEHCFSDMQSGEGTEEKMMYSIGG